MFCINVPKQQSKCQLGAQPIVICYTTTKNPIILSDDHTRLGDHIRNSLCKGKKTLFCSSAKIWWLKVLFFLSGQKCGHSTLLRQTVHFYDSSVFCIVDLSLTTVALHQELHAHYILRLFWHTFFSNITLKWIYHKPWKVCIPRRALVLAGYLSLAVFALTQAFSKEQVLHVNT